ncbi:hypothetical protein DER44DRAFT_677435, partial [Fusarium oxysporum]
IKATSSIYILNTLLYITLPGITCISATAIVAIIEEALRRGITDQPTKVESIPMADSSAGGY